jgi:hypothetical protein
VWFSRQRYSLLERSWKFIYCFNFKFSSLYFLFLPSWLECMFLLFVSSFFFFFIVFFCLFYSFCCCLFTALISNLVPSTFYSYQYILIYLFVCLLVRLFYWSVSLFVCSFIFVYLCSFMCFFLAEFFLPKKTYDEMSAVSCFFLRSMYLFICFFSAYWYCLLVYLFANLNILFLFI